jgi:hypothetical protein
MLGDEGTSICEDDEGVGWTSISWPPSERRNAEWVSQRAAVAMAGVAADLERRQESPQWPQCLDTDGRINWYMVCCRCEDLRPDIQKARRLHILSLDADRLLRIVDQYSSGNADATEDKALDFLFSQREQNLLYERLPHEIVEAYFTCATNVLSQPHAKRFVEEASRRLLQQRKLSGSECQRLWKEAA